MKENLKYVHKEFAGFGLGLGCSSKGDYWYLVIPYLGKIYFDEVEKYHDLLLLKDRGESVAHIKKRALPKKIEAELKTLGG